MNFKVELIMPSGKILKDSFYAESITDLHNQIAAKYPKAKIQSMVGS